MVGSKPINYNSPYNNYQNMPKVTKKGEILQKLLESPKTTSEIALSLKCVDEKGKPKYNNIYDDLKDLEDKAFILSNAMPKSGVPGVPGTKYTIHYEMSCLKILLTKFPFLIEDYQLNNHISSMLLKQHALLWFFYFNSPEFEDMLKENPDTDVEALINDVMDDFRSKLETSKTFFKICFLNDTERILSIFTRMYWEYFKEDVSNTSIVNEGLHKDGCDSARSLRKQIKSRSKGYNKDGYDQAPPLVLLNVAYKICLFIDSLLYDEKYSLPL